MFDSLSDRLTGVFDRLRGRGALNEADVREAMREVRIALLEADVALPVVREFVDKATEQAVGQQVLRSVTPGQQVVKIVHDALVEMLGAEEAGARARGHAAGRDHDGRPAGLGQDHHHRQARQAADREGPQEGADGVARRRPPGRAGAARGARRAGRRRDPADRRPASSRSRSPGARSTPRSCRAIDVLLLDTAGRLHVDQALMDEMKAVAEVVAPQRSAARRRFADRPGRGQRREELLRPGRR